MPRNSSFRTEFKQHVEEALRSLDLSATRFGYLSCGDPGFVRKLRAGGDFRLSTVERVLGFVARAAINKAKRG